MMKPGLQLYRQAIRVSKQFPSMMGRKIRYNARELLLLRRNITDLKLVEMYVQQGHDDLQLLQVLSKEPELIQAMSRK